MKVALYCRVSTEEQELNHQLKQLKSYVEKQDGWVIYKEYMDICSGAKDSRPAFNTLLEDMRVNSFDAVIVTKLDRIGRSLQHLLSLFDEFNKRGIGFIATTQNIDTSTSSGKLQMQIMGAFAEFERNLISERTKEGLKGNTKVGKRGKDKTPRKKRGVLKKRLSFINKGMG
jgi:DNA invertase Pin-like site-specific DNA recombinase